MTSGELKFALRVEMALNTVPVPELRQLMVETLLVLYNLVEYRAVEHFGGSAINVEEIVREANRIFLQDQTTLEGDAILCCAQGRYRLRYHTTQSPRMGAEIRCTKGLITKQYRVTHLLAEKVMLHQFRPIPRLS